jgi:hypothetical protein
VNADLSSRVAALPWHHSADFGGGAVTAFSNCTDEASLIFDRVNPTGRAVLDIGAWMDFSAFWGNAVALGCCTMACSAPGAEKSTLAN